MRKFFSFRSSSASGSEIDSCDVSDRKVEKVFWEKPQQIDAEDSGKDGFAAGEDSSVRSLNSTKKQEDSCPGLRRSFSFSGERHPSHRSVTPERTSKSKRYNLESSRRTHPFEIGVSPSTSKDHYCSSGNSPHTSPVPLRCRVARVKKISNKNEVLDLYIDGEKHEQILRKGVFPDSDGCLVENRTIANSWRPPRAYSTAPSSPICNKENVRSYPSGDMNDVHYHLSDQESEKYDARPPSPKKHSKKFVQRLSNAFSGRPRTTSPDYDSETTTTVEDIYEDITFTRGCSISDDVSQSCRLSDDVYHFKSANGYYLQEPLGFQKEENPSYLRNEEEIDKELIMKLKEAKERLELLTDTDLESKMEKHGNLFVPSILQLVKDCDRDRRYLALELVNQIECRIAERSSSKEALKNVETELSTRTRRLEKEKQELQSCLEKELDRRSCDWSVKLEKFQVEEQRLRERVRELAEQNVSLQREVSSLSVREADTQNKITNLELQLNDLTTQLEVVRKENQNLHQALLELKERCDLAEADGDCIKRSYKMKEKENNELHKIVVKFQKMCNEYEKTIAGLRQGLTDAVEQPQARGDLIHILQLEQLRLTGVEQTLRREIEACMNEVKSLRHENTCLLNRLRSVTGSSGSSVFQLDIELKSRLEYLQNQGLLLLYENIDLCGKLLRLVETQQFGHGKEIRVELDAYSVVEYNMKFHGLKRGVENLKRSLQVVSVTMKEKSEESPECRSQAGDNSLSKQKEDQDSEGRIELDLKVETLLTRILREKLLSKELELEQLKGDLASSLRGHEVLRSEVQRLQDELSTLTLKAKDVEDQIHKKDQSLNQLEQEFKECLKELNMNRNILPKVSNERDRLWEEVNQLKETDMLLKYEVKSLKKKIEALEEDVLIKEGQISILKDSIDTKAFDILYSPETQKQSA